MNQPLTLRVIDGADRGRVFTGLMPPITIGREEGNSIQLNDDRVSRFHVKIQSDNDRFVLTDLESTNGTKVNGEDIQLRILRFGDMISLGRSALIFGSRDDIWREYKQGRSVSHATRAPGEEWESASSQSDFSVSEASFAAPPDAEPPELPDRMSPGQAAQLAELLEYFRIRIRKLCATVEPTESPQVLLEAQQWQTLLDIQSQLAEYHRKISEP